MKPAWKDVVTGFSPAWYASVMGTGGLANVLYQLGQESGAALIGARVLFWLNLILFIVLLPPWITKWYAHYDRVQADLKHPLMSNFFVTMPAGCIILGTNFLLIGKDYFAPAFIQSLGLLLWGIGLLLAFAFAIAGMINLISTDMIGPDPINFAWLMTPVVNIVVPLLGNLLVHAIAPHDPVLAKFINAVDITFYGIGLILFLIISSVVVNRLILHKMPMPAMTPSFWVLLGPVGVGTVALMGLADTSKALGILTNVDSIKFLAIVLWGFGLYAFTLVTALTIKYIRTGGIPFTLSWWAFIFPLAAYTLSTLAVSNYLGVTMIKWYGLVLTLLLIVMWLITFVKTLIGTMNGGLFASR